MGKKATREPRPVDTARIEHQKQQRAERLTTLGALDCLHTVPAEELESLVELGMFRAFLEHEVIVHEHQQSNCLFMLLHGSVRLVLQNKEGHEVLIGVLDQGDCFGGSLFGDFFRRVGAYAETPCYLLQFWLSDIQALLATATALHTALRRIHLHRLTEFTLARVPLFNNFEPIERMALTSLLETERYARGSIVVQQGSQADALYLIESGQVVVERDNQTIATLEEGDFFGEMSLLSNQPHSATIQTITPADIAALPATDFHHLLTRRPDLKERLYTVINQRREMDEAVMDDQERAQRLKIAVENGLLRGNHLLMHNPERCPPGCRVCEQACIDRHGHARLRMKGFTIGSQHIVDTCRQCRISAECVEACPEHAFAWNEAGALYITDKCTGCGECIPACPYHAVNQVPREEQHPRSALDRLRQMSERLRHLKQPVISMEELEYIYRADKCDLCHGYDDLACVSKCPANAMRLVPIEEIFPL